MSAPTKRDDCAVCGIDLNTDFRSQKDPDRCIDCQGDDEPTAEEWLECYGWKKNEVYCGGYWCPHCEASIEAGHGTACHVRTWKKIEKILGDTVVSRFVLESLTHLVLDGIHQTEEHERLAAEEDKKNGRFSE